MIERANNVAKPERKRQAEMSDTPIPPPKRGRPKKDALLERYPQYSPSDASSLAVSESQKALDKELEKETPRKDLVLPMVKTTFAYRRPLVVQAASQKVSIQTLIGQHKCLRKEICRYIVIIVTSNCAWREECERVLGSALLMHVISEEVLLP